MASKRLALTDMGTFSGSFAWPYLFPFPQRPPGLIETAFDELARRWLPILDVCEEQGANLCYEIHPSEDLHDGISFEMFYERVGRHSRGKMLCDPSHFVLQQLNYLEFIDIDKEHIRVFHVKYAEFNPTGRQGIYGGMGIDVKRLAVGGDSAGGNLAAAAALMARDQAGPRWRTSCCCTRRAILPSTRVLTSAMRRAIR